MLEKYSPNAIALMIVGIEGLHNAVWGLTGKFDVNRELAFPIIYELGIIRVVWNFTILTSRMAAG